MVSAALQICLAYYIIAILDPYIMSWQCLNRPIVVAPLAGLILGDFKTGIIMGASLESIFMGISAIGGSIPADATTSSIIAVAYTILTGADIEAGLAIYCLTYRYCYGFHRRYVYTDLGFSGRLLGKVSCRVQSA